MTRSRGATIAALAVLSAIWGTQYLVIRLAQADLPPWRAVALRFFVVAILGQGAVLATGARAPAGVLRLRLAMGATHALSMGLLYAGQQQLPSAAASVLMTTTPILVVVLARWWLGEALGPSTLLGGALGVAGIVSMSGARWDGDFAAAGAGLVLGAALASAVSKTIGKAIVELPIAVLLRDLGAVVALTGLAASAALERDVPWTLGARELAGAAYLGAVASAGANAVYFVILRGIDVSRLSYLQLVSAGIGLASGVWVAGERLDTAGLAGVALVLAGAAIHGCGACPGRAAGVRSIEGKTSS